MNDVLVIGGGLAGAATALELTRAGRSVVLLEREAAPAHKVCGEFLSAETLESLAVLGVDVFALGAVPLDRVRLSAGSGPAAAVALPFRAASLTRRRLDAALLGEAERAGVDLRRGTAVERIETRDGLWHAQLANGGAVSAPDAVVAAGKHDLRERPRTTQRAGDWLAFKMYWKLRPLQAAALEGAVELALFRGGYAGLQQVEDGAVNLCCAVRRSAFRALGGKWPALLDHMRAECPLLGERLADAESLLAKPLAIGAVPYGWVRRSTQDGLWCVGDQAAVIPSFTGDGMALALASAAMAARSLVTGGSAPVFQQRFASSVRTQMRVARCVEQAACSAAGRLAAQTLLRVFPGLLSGIALRTRFAEA